MGAILKKSVDWSDTDVILPGESIEKAIVSLQILEVLNDEAIQVLLCKKFESAKRLYRFKPQNFLRWSDTGTFTPKNLNRQSDCIVSKPRIFKDKAIQILLRKKIWINEAIVSFQTAESFSDEAIQLLLLLLPGGDEEIHGFNPALKGQYHENFSPFSLEIWAPHKVDQLEKKQ